MKFSSITGQTAIKRKLIQTIADQRVSHAQLFFGPEGNEKLALAIAYAQFINCENRQFPDDPHLLPDSCGVCGSCVKYEKLVHPDLHFIYPVTTTKKVKTKPKSILYIEEWRDFLFKNDFHVNLHEWHEHIGSENKQGIINAEDCNEIIHTLSYKSYESEYKVMIIWMVERLFHSAAPKILKILEEPPEKTLFILIAEDTEQIISTIRSRTLQIKVPKISLEDIQFYLESKFGINEREAGIIARQSGGNLKLAVHKVQRVGEDQFNFTTFRNWMLACHRNEIIKLVGIAGELSKIGRENQKNLLSYALTIVQECSTACLNHEELIRAEGEELKFIRNISVFINPSNFDAFAELFNTALFHIERNAYPQVLFMDLSLQAVKLFQEARKNIRR